MYQVLEDFIHIAFSPAHTVTLTGGEVIVQGQTAIKALKTSKPDVKI